MSKPVIIMGNGGHASVLIETLLMLDKDIIGYTAPAECYGNLKYLGEDAIIFDYCPNEIELVLGIGTIGINDIRASIFSQYKQRGYNFLSVIHPSAIIASSVKLGEGIQVMAGAIIQTNTEISDNSIINSGAIVDHECRIGTSVHVAPGCRLSGGVKIENHCHVGTGAIIIQGKTIGHHTLIGAGSVVTKDIQPYKKVIGVPGKEV